ncbi:gamma-glutamyltranspeptidase/glutathione hydrolase [Allocatelliglobosispora scoriae]|uniref:Gamma-glutamyltranspeptidase/glutathione hydrolase n=1 Tax=Allocatelliglobosispora scoriae TaxID=643052 RepID=A0A841BVB4_9ACTN|nr:gamma-glutamyltransferase [Allocatelliglobosispora scoriae]MBB5871388.1 gamma-glutamyltranspeptidase/glutathione hydrolase [Allocatelliglobosispora scoriae]
MMNRRPVPAGIAGGHSATVEAGAQILSAGGNAVDAAVAATLAACAAETVACGLGGGGFATVFSARTGEVTVLDFFCAVPGIEGGTPGPMVPVDVRFGDVPISYAVGGASVAVPGIPAGCRELSRRFGRLPWSTLVEPAYALAREGVPLTEGLLGPLESIATAMLRSEGASAYAPTGRLLRTGECIFHAGLAETFARMAADEPFYSGRIADEMVASVRADGGVLDHSDLAAYRVITTPVGVARLAGRTIAGRDDLNNTLRTFRGLAAGLGRGAVRAVELAEILQRYAHQPKPPREGLGETTNVSVVDAEGNACVVTHTLGLGSGVWVPGMGLHLNSMLGEGELMTPQLRPGDRVGSMMCPLVVIGADERIELAVGSAGASRIRSALVSTVLGVVDEDLDLTDAIDAPRLHVADDVVHLELGYPDESADVLVERGFAVNRWSTSNHYFGAVSAVGTSGAAADPRRHGVSQTLP